MQKIAIIGATGAVGRELIRLFEKELFPIEDLLLFASKRSVGKTLPFGEKTLPIQSINEHSFQGVDLAIFCTERPISKEYIPLALQEGATVIDSSSLFRLDPAVPLIIPEINGDKLHTHEGLIASPNCTASLMLMPLAPLHRIFCIKRIVAATYQSASGAGWDVVEELKEETRARLEGKEFQVRHSPHPYAFNLFLHPSPLTEGGYSEEEIKVAEETQKILDDAAIQITVTCVRVPILRVHSIAVNVEFHHPITRKAALSILHSAPGIQIIDDWNSHRFPMPLDAEGKSEVLCGRIREDRTSPYALEMWIVGDQLLKGAALNLYQIAKQLTHGPKLII